MPGSNFPTIIKAWPQGQAVGSYWVVRMGAALAAIPTEAIKYLEQPKVVLVVPGAKSPWCGLVQDQSQLVAHFDLRASANAPSYCLILKTPKGDISLAADEVLTDVSAAEAASDLFTLDLTQL